MMVQQHQDLTASRHAPLVSAAAVLTIAIDWIVFATNMVSSGEALWVFSALGALVAMSATVGLQLRDAHDRHGMAVAKGLVVGLAVAAPLPLLGSAVGLVSLIWEWVARRTAHAH